MFNENFIDSNIKLQSTDGLSTVILLGNAVEHKDELNRLQDEETENNNTLQNLSETVETLNEELEIEKRALTNIIKESGWNSRIAKIRGNKTAALTAEVKRNLCDRAQNRPRPIYTSDEALEREIERYLLAASNPNSISRVINSAPRGNIEKIKATLARPILPPQSGDLGNRLSSNLQDSEVSAGYIEAVLRKIVDDSLSECPTCLQQVTELYRSELRAALNSVFDDEYDQKRQSVAQMIVNLESSALPDIDSSIDRNIVLELSLVQHQVEAELKKLNTKIREKIENPHLEIDWVSTALTEAEAEKFRLINKVNDEIDTWNRSVDAVNEWKIELEESVFDNVAPKIYRQLNSNNKIEQKIRVANNEIEILETRNSSIQTERRSLNAKIEQVEIALHRINDLLSIVFFDPSRLHLEYDCNDYRVKVRGSHVPPSLLSTGERNIIALAHFLTQVSAGRNFENTMLEPHLFVLDDPVSSFDFDNRYGVYCMLSKVVQDWHSSNQLTRSLILSHDFGTVDDLSKSISIGNHSDHITWQLKAGTLVELTGLTATGYDDLLLRIYNYAYSEEQSMRPSGNDIRRIFEAYCTFELNCSITAAFDAVKNRARFKEENGEVLKLVHSGLLRIALHESSHSEGSIKRGDYKLFRTFSDSEWLSICRSILIFMYMVSPVHTASRLPKEAARDYHKTLVAWYSKLLGNPNISPDRDGKLRVRTSRHESTQ